MATDRPATWTAARVWRDLSREEREALARAFFEQKDLAAEASALVAKEVAPRRGFREAGYLRLPVETKARLLSTIPSVREDLAASLLLAFHVERRRPLLARFLDLLGIPHENGLIGDDASPAAPTDAALKKATATLLSEFPVEHVRLYYRALVSQEPERWAAVGRALESSAFAAAVPRPGTRA